MKKFSTEFLEFSEKYEELRTSLSDAILTHVVVTISDERGIVWKCSDDEWQDKRFENWQVKQDFEIDEILKETLPIFVDLYEKFLTDRK